MLVLHCVVHYKNSYLWLHSSVRQSSQEHLNVTSCASCWFVRVCCPCPVTGGLSMQWVVLSFSEEQLWEILHCAGRDQSQRPVSRQCVAGQDGSRDVSVDGEWDMIRESRPSAKSLSQAMHSDAHPTWGVEAVVDYLLWIFRYRPIDLRSLRCI